MTDPSAFPATPTVPEHRRHPAAAMWTIVMAVPPVLILPVLFLVLLGGAVCEPGNAGKGCGADLLPLAVFAAIAGPLVGAAIGITGAWREWRWLPQIGLAVQILGFATACVAIVP